MTSGAVAAGTNVIVLAMTILANPPPFPESCATQALTARVAAVVVVAALAPLVAAAALVAELVAVAAAFVVPRADLPCRRR